jgi:hypothetical protein
VWSYLERLAGEVVPWVTQVGVILGVMVRKLHSFLEPLPLQEPA